MPTAILNNFSTVMATSGYLPWLSSEYGIGTVDFSTTIQTINPSSTLGTTLTQAQVGAELARQVAAKTLVPNDPTQTDSYIYMVIFPKTVTLQFTGGPKTTQSCVDFCGYHDIWPSGSGTHQIYFGAIPDINVCAVQPNGDTCKTTDFTQDTTAYMSHELAETLTDPDTVTGWRDVYQPGVPLPDGGVDTSCEFAEVGDLCIGFRESLFSTGATPP